MKAPITRPSEKQLATLASISDSIQSLWINLGDKYAEWNESNIHAIAHSRHITAGLRSSFQDYTYSEAQRAVGFMMKLKSSYQSMWNKKWRAESLARQEAKAEDERIVSECLTWEAVMEWMTRVGPRFPVPSYFEFVKRIGKVTYWKRREKTRQLFTRRQTEDKHHQLGLDKAGYMISKCWEPVIEPGYDGTLWELIPDLQYLLEP